MCTAVSSFFCKRVATGAPPITRYWKRLFCWIVGILQPLGWSDLSKGFLSAEQGNPGLRTRAKEETEFLAVRLFRSQLSKKTCGLDDSKGRISAVRKFFFATLRTFADLPVRTGVVRGQLPLVSA